MTLGMLHQHLYNSRTCQRKIGEGLKERVLLKLKSFIAPNSGVLLASAWSFEGTKHKLLIVYSE